MSKKKGKQYHLRRVNKEKCMPTPKYKGRSLKNWWRKTTELDKLLNE